MSSNQYRLKTRRGRGLWIAMTSVYSVFCLWALVNGASNAIGIFKGTLLVIALVFGWYIQERISLGIDANWRAK